MIIYCSILLGALVTSSSSSVEALTRSPFKVLREYISNCIVKPSCIPTEQLLYQLNIYNTSYQLNIFYRKDIVNVKDIEN